MSIGGDDAKSIVVFKVKQPAELPQLLEVLRDGKIAYLLKVPRKGRTHRVMTPMALMARLASLIPRPKIPLVRYHGVFASRSSWRPLVTPKPPPGAKWKPCAGAPSASASSSPEAPSTSASPAPGSASSTAASPATESIAAASSAAAAPAPAPTLAVGVRGLTVAAVARRRRRRRSSSPVSTSATPPQLARRATRRGRSSPAGQRSATCRSSSPVLDVGDVAAARSQGDAAGLAQGARRRPRCRSSPVPTSSRPRRAAGLVPDRDVGIAAAAHPRAKQPKLIHGATRRGTSSTRTPREASGSTSARRVP